MHHAAVDGQAAVALGQSILDLSAASREVDQQRVGRARNERTAIDMLRGALGNQLGLVIEAVKAIPGTVGVLSQMASQKLGDTAGRTVAAVTSRLKGRGASVMGKSVSNLALAPRTRLNTTVCNFRAFASERAVKKAAAKKRAVKSARPVARPVPKATTRSRASAPKKSRAAR